MGAVTGALLGAGAGLLASAPGVGVVALPDGGGVEAAPELSALGGGLAAGLGVGLPLGVLSPALALGFAGEAPSSAASMLSALLAKAARLDAGVSASSAPRFFCVSYNVNLAGLAAFNNSSLSAGANLLGWLPLMSDMM